MDLQTFKDFAGNLSPWAHVATVGADQEPDVVPIHPCWEGDILWFMGGAESVPMTPRGPASSPRPLLGR